VNSSAPYWFLTDSPQFHNCIAVQEQLIIILSWALKTEMMGEITYATFTFFIDVCMLRMPQFIPSVTALLLKYQQWGTTICLCPSVPASPDGDVKVEKSRIALPNSLWRLKQTCRHWVSRSSYSHRCSVQMKETILFQNKKPDQL